MSIEDGQHYDCFWKDSGGYTLQRVLNPHDVFDITEFEFQEFYEEREPYVAKYEKVRYRDPIVKKMRAKLLRYCYRLSDSEYDIRVSYYRGRNNFIVYYKERSLLKCQENTDSLILLCHHESVSPHLRPYCTGVKNTQHFRAEFRLTEWEDTAVMWALVKDAFYYRTKDDDSWLTNI